MITQLLADYGLFLIKTATLVAAILIVFSGLLALAMKNRLAKQKGSLEVEKLNDHYDDLKETIEIEVLDKKELKALEKERRKEEKQERKDKKKIKVKRLRLMRIQHLPRVFLSWILMVILKPLQCMRCVKKSMHCSPLLMKKMKWLLGWKAPGGW
ncbi:hypothetical protein DA717_05180 [Piscirickettsiaceae bacterium NZ-RLO2]|nr:hypothetical protein DA717_05180 [Piscirickettsiaceae bacterium NZ-RLO2]